MKPARNETAYAIGYISMGLIIGGLIALLFNYVIGLFIEYPVTWGNWGKTWLAFICFNILFKRSK